MPSTHILESNAPGAEPHFSPGLENVVAAETRTSEVNGQQGRLTIAGYAVEDIAPRASFEEMLFLLWLGRRPKPVECDELEAALAEVRTIPVHTRDLLYAAAKSAVEPMDALRMGVSSLPASSKSWNGLPFDALVLTATMPTMLGTFLRARASSTPESVVHSPPAPRRSGRHAEHVLHQLFGETRSEAEARALETYINTIVDHGFNASAYTARVIMSTRSDLVSAVSGAIGALKGPLHGGAPGPALDTVLEIQEACGGGAVDDAVAERILGEKLERGERLMGFGHRVYRVRDPRADVLGAAAERLYEHAAAGSAKSAPAERAADSDGTRAAEPSLSADTEIYEAARQVESIALRLLAEHKPHRKLQTNVEFYTALLLHGLGIPSDLFSSVFALGRVGGWIAHGLEQKGLDKLIRPRARYLGDCDLRWADSTVD